MKIHLRQLEAGQTQFAGRVEEDVYQLHDPDVTPVGGYEYEVEAGMQGDSVWAVGHVHAEFDLRCVNCLEKFRFPVDLPGFAAQKEAKGPEILDLTEEVREDILLALPPHPKCDWTGDVVCSGRQIAASHAPNASRDTPESAAGSSGHSWDALNQLKID